MCLSAETDLHLLERRKGRRGTGTQMARHRDADGAAQGRRRRGTGTQAARHRDAGGAAQGRREIAAQRHR